MRNITMSADEHLIDVARARARQKKTTLNSEFRKWLESYTNSASNSKRRVQTYRSLMSELSDISTGGRKFTRDEMNER